MFCISFLPISREQLEREESNEKKPIFDKLKKIGILGHFYEIVCIFS